MVIKIKISQCVQHAILCLNRKATIILRVHSKVSNHKIYCNLINNVFIELLSIQCCMIKYNTLLNTSDELIIISEALINISKIYDLMP